MKQNTMYVLLALFVVGILAVGAVSAFGGFGMPEVREALKAGDYQAYLKAFESRTPMTEEEFNTQVEMFQNKTEQRTELTAEQMAAMQEEREKIEAAMDEGYDTWKEAVADTPFGEKLTEVITEENFDKFVEMQNSMEHAKELQAELGLDSFGQHGGFGHGAFEGGGRI